MEHLLDQTRKFVVMGPDEKLWFFEYDEESDSWQASTRRPGLDMYVPNGPWLEESVYRFVSIYSHKLTNEDKLDLHLFLYKGGIEEFFAKSRQKE